MIDRRDAIFDSLRLWQDVNHNGLSEPEELHSLRALGLRTMELEYRESRRTDRHGNLGRRQRGALYKEFGFRLPASLQRPGRSYLKSIIKT